MRPEFSVEEQLLIQHIRSASSIRSSTFYVLAYLLVAWGLALYGLSQSAPLWMLAGLGMLTAVRMQELNSEKKWSSVWRSVVDKYDAALAQGEAEAASPEG